MNNDVAFIPVGELAEGFALKNHTLPASRTLASKSLNCYFSNGTCISCQFLTSTKLRWGDQSAVTYRATSIRDQIFFIDFADPDLPHSTVTLICDYRQGCFTLIRGQMPTEEQIVLSVFSRAQQRLPLTAVSAEIHFGTLDQPYNAAYSLHHFTRELIGMRNLYTYSPTERYEHIYLNEQFYTWHCLEGVEKGLADTDRCHYIKLAEKLYLFIWQEKIIPTLGIVLIDLQGMRTDGKIVGYQDNEFTGLQNFAVGAHATILNNTYYPYAGHK